MMTESPERRLHMAYARWKLAEEEFYLEAAQCHEDGMPLRPMAALFGVSTHTAWRWKGEGHAARLRRGSGPTDAT